ncbi:AEC family transporter [Sulfitobacter sp. LCG007]
MQTLLDVILPVFIVLGFGYAAVWRGAMAETVVEGLLRFAQSFAIPCLLFRAISRLDLSTAFDPGLIGGFFGAAAICFFLGLFGARTLFQRDLEDSIAIGFCCLFSNAVLLGLSITERAYGSDALDGNYMILAFHAPFCYAVGIIAMEIVRNRGASHFATAKAVTATMFRNAILVSIMLGVLVNLSGLAVPAVIGDALDLIARAALPTALFALGGVLTRYRPEGDIKAVAMVCFISLLVHPSLLWLFGTAMDLSEASMRSGVVTAAMAPGVNTYLFANQYGRAKRVAASSMLAATGLSFLTAWFWLHVLS